MTVYTKGSNDLLLFSERLFENQSENLRGIYTQFVNAKTHTKGKQAVAIKVLEGVEHNVPTQFINGLASAFQYILRTRGSLPIGTYTPSHIFHLEKILEKGKYLTHLPAICTMHALAVDLRTRKLKPSVVDCFCSEVLEQDKQCRQEIKQLI